MTLAGSIKQFVESIAKSARIISPRFSDYKIESFDFYSEAADIDSSLRADVVKIIQDEIKLQLTEVRVGETEAPSGSVESQLVTNVRKGAGAIQNPMGALSSAIKGIPIPHAQLLALALAMAPIIFELTTRDGGPLDLRFRRRLLKEQNSFLDRQTQRNTQIGLRQVIIQSRAGFIQMNGGAGNENTNRQIRDGGVDGNRLAQIEMADHAKELFSP